MALRLASESQFLRRIKSGKVSDFLDCLIMLEDRSISPVGKM